MTNFEQNLLEVNMKFHVESDNMGNINMPEHVYWGAQTQKSKENFCIGSEKFSILFIQASLAGILQLAQGGTAVGTGLNTCPQYIQKFAEKMTKTSGLPFVSAPNKFAIFAVHDNALVFLSGSLNTLTAALLKIVNDVCWLANGPRGGLGEISIAVNEPGSSIMLGKINPTRSEVISMVGCQVMDNYTTINIAGSQGNFQLNIFKLVMIFNVLQFINLLSDRMNSFDEHCANSIQPNIERLNELKSRSLMLVTALAPHIGYDKAASVAKKAHEDGTTMKRDCFVVKFDVGTKI